MGDLRAGEITARLLDGPRRFSPDWLIGGKDAVPFAAASGVAPVVAGRLAAAVQSCGERRILACAVAQSRAAEMAVVAEARGTGIHAVVQSLGTADALLALPDLSAALLATEAGFAVAAGSRQFVEVVAGSDVRRARSSFADFALAALGSSAQPMEAAAYYGCALSGRPWRPAWLAWHRAADVPYGSGVGGQLAAMRQVADGRLAAEDFERSFRAARRQEIAAGERAAGPLAAALDGVCWALDGYLAPGEGRSRAPGDMDLAELREAVKVALADV